MNQMFKWGIKWSGIIGFCALALFVAYYAAAMPFHEFRDAFHMRYNDMSTVLFGFHTIFGAIALLVGTVQLLMPRKKGDWHRYLGRLYGFAILFSCIGGYYLAWHAFGGWISMLGLGTLATLWWSFTAIAIYYAVKGDYRRHRRWIIRSFALTAAAVTLRLMSPFAHAAFDGVTAQQFVYWASWLFNLAVIEVWLRFKAAPQHKLMATA